MDEVAATLGIETDALIAIIIVVAGAAVPTLWRWWRRQSKPRSAYQELEKKAQRRSEKLRLESRKPRR